MGMQVQYKSYLGGYNPMRDLNDDSNGNGWPLFYGEKNLANGQYYTGFIPRTIADAYPGYDKNSLKQKMLEHEAIFKNQVYELHRLYQIQRDMMEEVKTKERHRHRGSIEPSTSSSRQGSQAPSEDVRKWHIPSYPMVEAGYSRSTVFGADILNSPMSCMKGNNTMASLVPPKNGCTKDFEVSDARPSKVRKKLFNLQLPADEYIDTEDAEQQDTKVSGCSSFTPTKDHLASEGVASDKRGSLQEGFSSVSHLRSSFGLADLNEPVEVEEATESSSIDIFGHSACNGGVKGIDLSAKPNLGFLQKEVMLRSRHESHTDTVNTSPSEIKVNGGKWLPYSYGAGHVGGNHNSVSRGAQQEKLYLPATPTQAMHGQAYSSEIHFTDISKEDHWKERVGRGLEAPHRSHNHPNHTHMEPIMASQVRNSYPFIGSPDVANTCPQFMSSWGKPADSLTQKLSSFHTHPSLNSSPSLNKMLGSSVLNHDNFGDKWQANSSSRLNPGLASDLPSRNGFYQGSSSGSKDLPVCFSSAGFDHLNSSRSANIVSEHVANHGMEKAFTGFSYTEVNPPKDMNLNVSFSGSVSYGKHLEVIDGRSKPAEHQPLLPWLRPKPVSKCEAQSLRRDVICLESSPPQASPSSLFGKRETVQDLNRMFNAASTSSNHEIRPKNEASETLGVKKILGISICEKHSAPEIKASSLISFTPEGENLRHEKRNSRLIDINVACDASLLEYGDEPVMEEVLEERPLDKSSCVRSFIDLNSCITEDEDPPVASMASITARKRVAMEIDLEAPAVPEDDEDPPPEKEKENEVITQPPDHISERTEDDVVRGAAEAIVVISSSQHIIEDDSICALLDAAVAEPLLWFADLVTSTADKSIKSGKDRSSYEEMDDFEAMTLQLPETKEEDYMPEPFFPEVQVEETGTSSLPPRPRRGQARRGRQRRDFQRDILPGLSSLSRHEVTEDLQTFGGLMRATGHVWNPGLTRRNGTRNGGARGRRRTVVEAVPAPSPQLVQQLNHVETGLEDRSLTSWGKTTRRPRRQRCPAGNAPTTIALT